MLSCSARHLATANASLPSHADVPDLSRPRFGLSYPRFRCLPPVPQSPACETAATIHQGGITVAGADEDPALGAAGMGGRHLATDIAA